MFRIPLLQRYIFKEILRVFLFILSCITVLLVFFGLFREATDRGLSPEDVLKILPYIVPSMLPFTIPAALLLTISVVYGRMSGDQEVIAAKAAGIHPASIMWPALLLGGVLSVLSLVLTDQVIPWSMGRIEQHIATVMEDLFLERLKTELQFSDPSRGIHITVTGVKGRTLLHPVIRYVRDRQPVTLRAEQAQIRLDLEAREAVVRLNNIYLDLGEHGSTYYHGLREERIRFDLGSGDRITRHIPIQALQKEQRQIESKKDDVYQRRLISAMMSLSIADFEGLKDGSGKGESFEAISDRFHKIRTEIHNRYAMACSCFFFALLGTPFSILFGKSQFLTSFLLCFVPIVAGYYPLMLGLMTQAKLGNLEPSWGMWIGNACLLVVSWFVSRRVLRY